MLVYACITYDFHLIDGCRFTFVHSHLKVNGVVLHIHLHRFHIEKEVSSVGIEFAHRIVVVDQAVVQRLEVIYIAGFDT